LRHGQDEKPAGDWQRREMPEGEGIFDFRFSILDFGFWILDFGFWILDFV
jgi:hypothetical protein